MKLSAYKDLESSKRAQTMSRIILIAGAHLVIIGGIYLATTFGGKRGDKESLAGVGTWSSQSPSANEPSVDASARTLFDSRANDLAGYNAGEAKPVLLASNSAPASSSSAGRYAPRRPSDSASPAPSSRSAVSSDDDFLQPVGRSNDDLYPVYNSGNEGANLSDVIEYKVQSGDSIWGLTQRFKVSKDDILDANPGIKANAIRVGQTLNIPRSSGAAPSRATVSKNAVSSPSPKPVNGSVYTVKAGDSLSRIAGRQGVTVPQLQAANGMSNDVIRIGQELVIPTKTSSSNLVSMQHRGPKVTVKAGDTLDQIAQAYGVSVNDLKELNNISNPWLIRIGQVILIPESSPRESVRPQAQTTVSPRREPTRASNAPPQELPSLDDLPPPPQDLPTLPTLDDSFGADDLEDQPLIQISE